VLLNAQSPFYEGSVILQTQSLVLTNFINRISFFVRINPMLRFQKKLVPIHLFYIGFWLKYHDKSKHAETMSKLFMVRTVYLKTN